MHCVLRFVPLLSNDCFVCNMTCLDIAHIVCLVLLFSRVDVVFPKNLTKDTRTSLAPLPSKTMPACNSHIVEIMWSHTVQMAIVT